MLPVDIPTPAEIRALNALRADACVSIYLPTTPLTQEIDASRIAFGNLAKEAAAQLQAVGFDKRRLAPLVEQLDDLADDDAFWRFQGNSLVVFATPETVRTFRLANRLNPAVEVADRFHIKPLLRAITFPHAAFVLALSEDAARLVEVFADLPPAEVRVADMPKDAASFAGKASLKSRSPSGRIQGSEGKKVRLTQYARAVDAALRPVLAGLDAPLILASTEPLTATFRSVCSYPHLLARAITGNPERTSASELAAAARPLLDETHAEQIREVQALYERRAGDRRVTTDLSDAARAATFGAIEALLVDIDSVVPGRVDEESGAITLADAAGATSYGVVDEIAGRALASGARVLGVRRDDIPGGGELAAILRHPV